MSCLAYTVLHASVWEYRTTYGKQYLNFKVYSTCYKMLQKQMHPTQKGDAEQFA